jgi:hypothetical protein
VKRKDARQSFPKSGSQNSRSSHLDGRCLTRDQGRSNLGSPRQNQSRSVVTERTELRHGESGRPAVGERRKRRKKTGRKKTGEKQTGKRGRPRKDGKAESRKRGGPVRDVGGGLACHRGARMNAKESKGSTYWLLATGCILGTRRPRRVVDAKFRTVETTRRPNLARQAEKKKGETG